MGKEGNDGDGNAENQGGNAGNKGGNAGNQGGNLRNQDGNAGNAGNRIEQNDTLINVAKQTCFCEQSESYQNGYSKTTYCQCYSNNPESQ